MAAERELAIRITGDARGLGRAFGVVDKESSRLERGLGRARSGLISLGKAAGIATAALGAAGVAMAKTSIDAASDLEESINKTSEVFKAAGRDMLEWSKTSAEAMGLSRAAALEGASSIGAMLTPMGIAPKRAAEMSKTVAQLAADMASFNNEDPTEMLDRIRAGLSGESEPLKRFGSVLSETRVQQYAWANGIAESGEKLTEQQKIMARYGLLLQDTKDQQGDFARTSDGLANAQRIVAAQWQDMSAALGEALIPAAAKAMSIVNDMIGHIRERMPQIREVIASVMDRVQQVVGAAVGFISANWPAISATAQDVFGRVRSVVTSVVDAVVPIVQSLIDTVVDLAPKMRPVVDEVGRLMAALAEVISAVARRIQQLWSRWGDEIMAVVRFTFTTLARIIRPLLATVRSVIETIAAAIRGDWSGVWDGLLDTVRNTLRGIWALLRGAVSVATTTARALGEAILKGLGNALKGTASAVREGVVTGLRKLGDLTTAALNKGVEIGKRIVKGVVNAIKDGAGEIAEAVWDAIPGSGTIKDAVSGVIGLARGAFGFSRGGMLPGTYMGRDTMVAALAPGEAVLTPRQQEMIPGGRAMLNAIFAATGGRVGGSSFSGGGYVNPVPGGSWGGGPYQGTHRLGNWQSDAAYDIFAPHGTPVVAGFAGVIGRISPFSSDPRFWGHGLYLSGGPGQLFYKHLKDVTVRSGQSVRAGQVLGHLGTGVNGGPHLHLGANPVSLLNALRSGGTVTVSGDGGTSTGGGDGPGPSERSAPPPLNDRQKLAKLIGIATGRPGLGEGRKISKWVRPLVNTLSRDVPDVSGGLPGTSYTGAQSRAISKAARKARAAARAAGKSPEEVRQAGEEAERKAELLVLRRNRRAVIQARAGLRKKKKALFDQWRKLTRKPAKTAKARAARRQATAKIKAKLREHTHEINDLTEMIAEINERIAELGEQAIDEQHQANYDAQQDAAGEGGDAGGDAGGGAGAGDEPTELDWLNLEAVQAQFTEDTGDDLTVARKLEGYWDRAARAATDPREKAQALQQLLLIRQQIKALTENTQALADNTEALRGFSGAVTFQYRGQDYTLRSLAPPSSDRIENVGVGA